MIGRAARQRKLARRASVAPPCVALSRDDILLHRRQDRDQLLLLARRHLELVERLAEVADQRVEMARADAHPSMGLAHAAAGVDAWAARALPALLPHVP